MSAEENKSIMRRFWEGVNKGDMAVMDELAAPDVTIHFAGLPKPVRGIEAWKRLGEVYYGAFPDLQATQEGVIAEGDRIAARVTWTATHQGELMGILPTGKRVTVTGMRIFRLAGGKIVEEWGVDDTLGMMRQLGVIPASGQGEG